MADGRLPLTLTLTLTLTLALTLTLTLTQVSAEVFAQLAQLCQALAAGDAATALQIHVAITTSDWADNGQWLMGLKRLIEMVGKLQVRL